MISTVQAEETTLPELLQKLHAGDAFIITSGESKTPVARMEALSGQPVASKRLGFLYNPKFQLPSDFFDEDLDDCEPQ